MSTTHKKVLVRRFSGDILAGYLPISTFVRDEPPQAPTVDLLDLAGRVIPLPLDQIKMVSYVRDFNLADTQNPERLGRRSFLARPRAEGLWLRLIFLGGDMLEGLAASDISFLLNAIEDRGVHLTPPDIRSNTQHIFVPRSALADLQVVAVITTPSRKKPIPLREISTLQETLFAAPLGTTNH